MINKEISWAIALGEALLINNNEFINIPIDRENYTDIFANNHLSNRVISLLDANRMYFDKRLHDGLCRDFDYGIEISMHPNFDKTTYEIGYDLNEIFYNIFKKIDLSFHKKNFDFDDENEIQSFKEYVTDQLEIGKLFDLLTKTDPEFYNSKYDIDMQIIFNLENHLDEVVDQIFKTNKALKDLINKQVTYDQDKRDKEHRLEITKDSLIVPKNLLAYTAAKALHIYEETDDIKYYRYCKDYYNNISSPRPDKHPEHPKSMFVDKYHYSYDFHDFNNNFNYIRNNRFNSLLIELGDEDKDTYTVGRTLKQGTKKQVIKLNKKSFKKKPNYSKANKALKRKITFYKGLKNKGIISGVEQELDYIGFVLDNNYVILDKFYDLNKDGSIKGPAINNAIYVTTLDVLEACDYDKAKIRDFIKKNGDFRAFRLYHNDTDSYQKKVTKVLEYKDLSTIKFEDLKDENK